MIIEVDLGLSTEYLSCSADAAREIDDLREQFLYWLNDRDTDHNYWVYRDGEKWGLRFRTDAFVYWLNNHSHIKDEETVELLKEAPKHSDKKIYF